MQHIIQHLFQTGSLEDVPRQRLEELVEEYPSFGIARYLLSRKLRAEDDARFKEETLKTNLYFSNPFWLQWQLNSSQPAAHVAAPAQSLTQAPEPLEVPVHPVIEEETPPVAAWEEPNAALQLEPIAAAAAEISETPETFEPPVTDHASAADPILPENTPSAADQLLASIAELRSSHHKAEEEAAGHIHTPAAPEPQTTSIAAMALEQADEYPTNSQFLPSPEPEEPAIEAALPPTETEPEITETEPETTEAEQDATEAAPIPTTELPEHIEEFSSPAFTPQAEPEAEAVAESNAEAPVPVAETPAEPTSPAPASPLIAIEPYHTIDYFASQGIRLSLDENPSDKLGRQMKSFTDWLKTMRKLPQKNQEIIPDIAAEHQVRAIAAHSIESREVLTETMAEVLAKQGMREKATEVYLKLSLLNPDKSSYFANKIEQLKID